MSYDAYTSGTSRGLTVPSLQQLKMEAVISAPADCEVQSVIKFLNAQSIAPIKIHHQLCQVYGHTWLKQSTHLLLVVGWEVFNHHTPYRPRPHTQWFPSFLTPQEIPVWSASGFSERKRGRDEYHSGSNPKWQTSMIQDTKVGPMIWQISQFQRGI